MTDEPTLKAEDDLLERAALALEDHAVLMVEMARKMGLTWSAGQQAKHAGYLEDANIVRQQRHPNLPDSTTGDTP